MLETLCTEVQALYHVACCRTKDENRVAPEPEHAHRAENAWHVHGMREIGDLYRELAQQMPPDRGQARSGRFVV